MTSLRVVWSPLCWSVLLVVPLRRRVWRPLGVGDVAHDEFRAGFGEVAAFPVHGPFRRVTHEAEFSRLCAFRCSPGHDRPAVSAVLSIAWCCQLRSQCEHLRTDSHASTAAAAGRRCEYRWFSRRRPRWGQARQLCSTARSTSPKAAGPVTVPNVAHQGSPRRGEGEHRSYPGLGSGPGSEGLWARTDLDGSCAGLPGCAQVLIAQQTNTGLHPAQGEACAGGLISQLRWLSWWPTTCRFLRPDLTAGGQFACQMTSG